MGYVETTSLGIVLLENVSGIEFKTPKEALKHLAHALFQKYTEDHPVTARKCCSNTDKKNTFCGKCGRVIGQERIDLDKYHYELTTLPSRVIDGFGEEIPGWEPWSYITRVMSLKPGELVEVSSEADKLLILLLDSELVSPEFKDTVTLWNAKEEFEVFDSGQEYL